MFDLLRDLDVSDDDIYEDAADRDAAVDWQQSGVDHYSDEGYDEDEDEDVRDGTYEGKKFPPVPKDWKETSTKELPHVTYDMARIDFWEHGKSEIRFFLEKMLELREALKYEDDLDCVVAVLFDQNSNLYQAFRKIEKRKTSHEEFLVWLSRYIPLFN